MLVSLADRQCKERSLKKKLKKKGQIWFRLKALRAAACQGELRKAPGTQQKLEKGRLRDVTGKASHDSAEFGPGRVPHDSCEAEALQGPS